MVKIRITGPSGKSITRTVPGTVVKARKRAKLLFGKEVKVTAIKKRG